MSRVLLAKHLHPKDALFYRKEKDDILEDREGRRGRCVGEMSTFYKRTG